MMNVKIRAMIIKGDVQEVVVEVFKIKIILPCIAIYIARLMDIDLMVLTFALSQRLVTVVKQHTKIIWVDLI